MQHILVFIITIAITLMRAFVVSIMWEWFVSPAFGLEAPSVAAIAGLLYLFAMITSRRVDLDKVDIQKEIAHGLISPWVYLALAFPLSFFV